MEKLFFTKKIRYKNVQCFNLVHAHKPKFGRFFAITRSEFFFLTFPFLCLRPFTSLPFALHFVSGCCKKLGVNCGQSLEMISYRTGIIGRFTTIFTPKLITLFFQVALGQNAE